MPNLCSFGCNQPAIKQFKSGNYCCSNSTSSCPEQKRKNGKSVSTARTDKGDNYWLNGHPKGAKGKTPHNKGKSYDELYSTEDAERLRKIHSETGKRNGGPCGRMSAEQLEEHRKQASKNAYARHAAGWDNKAGRCKKYLYYSEINGRVTLDGTWELSVADWLEKNKFTWKRNKQRFSYTGFNNETKHYTPDFWVEEFNSYIEVKGFITELDKRKWQQFEHTLLVWKSDHIKDIRKKYPLSSIIYEIIK